MSEKGASLIVLGFMDIFTFLHFTFTNAIALVGDHHCN
jgi:DNA primase